MNNIYIDDLKLMDAFHADRGMFARLLLHYGPAKKALNRWENAPDSQSVGTWQGIAKAEAKATVDCLFKLHDRTKAAFFREYITPDVFPDVFKELDDILVLTERRGWENVTV